MRTRCAQDQPPTKSKPPALCLRTTGLQQRSHNSGRDSVMVSRVGNMLSSRSSCQWQYYGTVWLRLRIVAANTVNAIRMPTVGKPTSCRAGRMLVGLVLWGAAQDPLLLQSQHLMLHAAARLTVQYTKHCKKSRGNCVGSMSANLGCAASPTITHSILSHPQPCQRTNRHLL